MQDEHQATKKLNAKVQRIWENNIQAEVIENKGMVKSLVHAMKACGEVQE